MKSAKFDFSEEQKEGRPPINPPQEPDTLTALSSAQEVKGSTHQKQFYEKPNSV